MEREDNKKQQEDFIKWCEKRKLEPKQYKNLKDYLKEVEMWDSTQTK